MPDAKLRKAAMQIFRAALKAADPAEAVRRHFKQPAATFDRIFVVGAGEGRVLPWRKPWNRFWASGSPAD